jgi:type I restriction-modification system DNA methylase subunit
VGEYYTRQYETCSVSVDFDNEQLIYPEKVTVNDKTTSNFSHNENFVVFECVCRLLQKGYRPEHIELEPKWQLGRDAKSGKADIVVKDSQGNVLIIIECKTAGTEYNKELKNTEEYGGQLFSYWQQENAARWLALYSSDLRNDDVVVRSHVINCSDDANIEKLAQKDKNVLLYKDAKNDVERFEVWDETYNKQWLDNLIFDEESQAYNIGIPPLRKYKLKDFTPDDKIVNQFEEILRHNNVSDKENAFNRLIALFICKLVDEIKKQDGDEVEFQYKQGVDTYESLQDRLQRLHTQGMEEFMREKIFYVAEDYAERLFQQYTGSKRKAAIEDLKNTIRILKFYSNNDFAFKDVHNEELFFQNGKILVEVVQLFQPYRIVYASKHQFLGDLFEQLLNKGFKQNEGQFFTPTPITRFIWDSLPLKKYIFDHGIPNVIDYACGAGHFLTEGIEAINAIRQDNDNSWVEKHIFGIEKDYRLARVSKISLFMNGAGGANIIFGDGLENYREKSVEPSRFDILVANPPYSVSSFKQHLKLRDNYFRLLDFISNSGNEIETLFVERIAQLLKPQGLAAIVLPAPILSNTSKSYIAAREELLKNFHIRGIVSFGNKTFGKTGTNTVTLFLEKYNEPPRIAELVKDSVVAIMSGCNLENFIDKQILSDYVEFQGLTELQYTQFIKRDLDWTDIYDIPYFKAYADKFAKQTIKLPKNCTAEKEEAIRREKFYDFALAIEEDKLYFFSLVRQQQTVIITAPLDNKDQKTFLGYDWTDRKGSEGIVINNPGGQLYNANDRFACGTLACAIRDAFVNATTDIPDDIAQYIKTFNLKNLLDFTNVDFNKSIKTAEEKTQEISSKYQLVNLGGDEGACNILIGGTPSRKNITYFQDGDNLWVSIAEMNGQVITDTKEKITDEAVQKSNVKLVPAGTTLLSFKLSIGKVAIAGKDLYTNEAIAGLVPKDKRKLEDKYLFYLFGCQIIDLIPSGNKAFGKSLNSTFLNENVKIPLPPIDIQKQIIKECESVDEEYNNSRMLIETYRQKISDIFSNLHIVNKSKQRGGVISLNFICEYALDRISSSKINLSDYITTDNMLQNYDGIKDYQGEQINGSVIEYKRDDILISNIRPYLKKIWLADKSGGCSPDVLVLRVRDKKLFNPRFIYYALRLQNFFDYVMKDVKGMKMPRGDKNNIMRYEVPMLSMQEQTDILHQVEHYEEQIAECRAVINSRNRRIKEIIESYLS